MRIKLKLPLFTGQQIGTGRFQQLIESFDEVIIGVNHLPDGSFMIGHILATDYITSIGRKSFDVAHSSCLKALPHRKV